MFNIYLLRFYRGTHRRLCVPISRCLHNKITESDTEKPKTPKLIKKYETYRDEDSVEIFDVQEESRRYQNEIEPQELYDDELIGLNKKRGIEGVFDIEDLVDVLHKENAEDVFVCLVPKTYKYVDYMVICSGRSYRHMLSIAQFVHRIYKIKRSKTDVLPKIEGKNSRDWIALDLGNIALHIFSPIIREEYDLESLWSIGPEYDKELNKPDDELVELFKKNSILLSDLTPKSSV